MNPGATMLRVYAGLKQRIMAGEFAPGERLDPKRLADDLLTSTSPVRDALHRLHGERLVENWPQEGFRQPFISEAAIRDLYQWSAELMPLVLRAATRGEGQRVPDVLAADRSYASEIARCFNHIAQLSPNHEHRVAVSNLIDRSTLHRSVEEACLDDAIHDINTIHLAVARAEWPVAAKQLDHFHKRRLQILPMIAAAFRSAPG